MIALSTIFILIVLSSCNGQLTNYKKCFDDKVNFADKVQNSSVVVYGKVIGKALYGDNDTRFYALFDVDCVLKGPVVEKQINITEAGEVQDRVYCQELPVGQDYMIVFLQRNPLNENDLKTFIPADFVEMRFSSTEHNDVLINTCNLQQTPPLGSTGVPNECPVVSTATHCLPSTTIPAVEMTSITSDESEHGFDHIQGKSGAIPVGDNPKNGGNSINIHILLIFMAMLIIRLN